MINPVDLSGKNIRLQVHPPALEKELPYFEQIGSQYYYGGKKRGRLKEVYGELEPGNHSYYIMDLNDLDRIKVCLMYAAGLG